MAYYDWLLVSGIAVGTEAVWAKVINPWLNKRKAKQVFLHPRVSEKVFFARDEKKEQIICTLKKSPE